jgi:hypothetical protein
LVVHASPSLHANVLLLNTQPLRELQVSVVQALKSLQTSGAPPVQTPPPQVSFVVHALPSLQDRLFAAFEQPRTESQVSVVQMLPSLQFGAAPPTQVPPLHASFVVHASPSSHELALGAFTHPLPELQVSVVQALPSLQLGGAPPTHAPPLQVSAVVHASPSSQPNALFVNTQPEAGLHESEVQTLLSLQTSGAPPKHTPPLQVSLVVHVLPSSQLAVLFVNTQPEAELHESDVQTLPSLQTNGTAPVQTPPPQVSTVVHASPSLQDAVLLV